MAKQELIRRAISYGFIGLLQIVVDWMLFIALTSAGASVIPSNLCSRVAGAILGFWLNGSVTFRDGDGVRLGWKRFYRFLISWGVMSVASTIAMHFFDQSAGLKWTWMLKPLVDTALAILGFMVSRSWIYK